MRKILSILLICTLLYSCDDYLDVNKNPNRPEDVDIYLLVPSTQIYTAAVVGGDLYNITGFMAQYTDQNPEANQYNSLTQNSFSTDLFNRSYSNIYAGTLQDLEKIRQKASATNDWSNYYAATVLRAYIMQIFVDVMDRAPFSEALKGVDVPQPKWDSGEDIYKALIAELDDAKSKLTSATGMIPSDLLLDGKLTNWVKFGNAVKLKLYMRSSNVWDNSLQVKALIQENNFFSGDIKLDSYKDETSRRNPWYETNIVSLTATNHVASYPIISYMEETEDPRISTIFKVAKKTSKYVGAIPGSKNLAGKVLGDYSTLVTNPKAPVYLYTQTELQFFLAEAYLRYYNDDAKAKNAYESAIDANFSLRVASDPNVIYGAGKTAAWSNAKTQEQKIKLIGMQKWVSLCMINNAEAWAEMRRLNVPSRSVRTANEIISDPSVYTSGDLISPLVNSLSQGQLALRLYYPQNSINLNPNTPKNNIPNTITEPVWWDKN